MATEKKVNLEFHFIIPTDDLLAKARDLLDTPDQDTRDVAKALLDTTEVSVETKTAMAKAGAKDKVEMAPYFDHWVGDAVEAANRLLNSPSADIRNMAKALIDQSNAIISSKESFLKETKRAFE